ncbi:MAG: hypothetical protein R2736_13955 [Solirubrobacterales bacterium]
MAAARRLARAVAAAQLGQPHEQQVGQQPSTGEAQRDRRQRGRPALLDEAHVASFAGRGASGAAQVDGQGEQQADAEAEQQEPEVREARGGEHSHPPSAPHRRA